MDSVQPPQSIWKKSSRSGGGQGQCVEVGFAEANPTAVRDSKNPNGPVLVFQPGAVVAFLGAVKNGQLG